MTARMIEVVVADPDGSVRCHEHRHRPVVVEVALAFGDRDGAPPVVQSGRLCRVADPPGGTRWIRAHPVRPLLHLREQCLADFRWAANICQRKGWPAGIRAFEVIRGVVDPGMDASGQICTRRLQSLVEADIIRQRQVVRGGSGVLLDRGGEQASPRISGDVCPSDRSLVVDRALPDNIWCCVDIDLQRLEASYRRATLEAKYDSGLGVDRYFTGSPVTSRDSQHPSRSPRDRLALDAGNGCSVARRSRVVRRLQKACDCPHAMQARGRIPTYGDTALDQVRGVLVEDAAASLLIEG